MTRQPVTVPANASIEEALQRMRGAGVRRVPLVDGRGRLAGILALDDIYDHFEQRGMALVTPIRREPRHEQHAT
jgi:CBS domain-containing protein